MPSVEQRLRYWRERALTAEAKLAQYEAQEPVAWRFKWKDEDQFSLQQREPQPPNRDDFDIEPLYASPAPAVDLKAERDKYKQALEDINNKCVTAFTMSATASNALNPSEPQT